MGIPAGIALAGDIQPVEMQTFQESYQRLWLSMPRLQSLELLDADHHDGLFASDSYRLRSLASRQANHFAEPRLSICNLPGPA